MAKKPVPAWRKFLARFHDALVILLPVATVTGLGSVEMARVRQRKRAMVEGLIAMHLERYRASGAELIVGTGRFVAPKTFKVRLNDGGTRLLTRDRVFLNVGTHATIPEIPRLVAA